MNTKIYTPTQAKAQEAEKALIAKIENKTRTATRRKLEERAEAKRALLEMGIGV
jgi:hypothetical protein